MDTFTVFICIVILAFVGFMLFCFIHSWMREPNCKRGGLRHNWYRGDWGCYMAVNSRVPILPGEDISRGNHDTNPARSYRWERHCRECDREEYKDCTDRLNPIWRVIPGKEGTVK